MNPGDAPRRGEHRTDRGRPIRRSGTGMQVSEFSIPHPGNHTHHVVQRRGFSLAAASPAVLHGGRLCAALTEVLEPDRRWLRNRATLLPLDPIETLHGQLAGLRMPVFPTIDRRDRDAELVGQLLLRHGHFATKFSDFFS